MKYLTINDFKRERIMGSPATFFSHKSNRVEICLEPCLNGFDVGLYDLDGGLLKPKVCLNSTDNSDLNDAFSNLAKALDVANEFYQDIE